MVGEVFKKGQWVNEIEVRNFIQLNYTEYQGNDSFLTGPTEKTDTLMQHFSDLSQKEREKGGVLNMDTKIVSTITSHQPGYLDQNLEEIVGVQTDEPFKRSLQPFGGIRMAKEAESLGMIDELHDMA